MTWTILALVIFIIYFVITFYLMYRTTTFNFTFNYTIFRYQLKQKGNRNLIHYFEMALLTLVLIGFLTTVISIIQVLLTKRKKDD